MYNRKASDKKYRNSKKGKITANRGYAKYRKTEKYRQTQLRYRQTEKYKLAQKRYRQSKKGRMDRKKRKALYKRKLNFIPMFENPFSPSEKINWHHINDTYVVAIPEDLHLLYNGPYHREKVMTVVTQIYLWRD